MTLVGKPRTRSLDEPTAGLNPRSRRTMWGIVYDLVEDDGFYDFLTTRYLEEADEPADGSALPDQGRPVPAEGQLGALEEVVPGGDVSLRLQRRGLELNLVVVMPGNDELVTKRKPALQVLVNGASAAPGSLLGLVNRPRP